jgi:hypothetical protein
VYERDKQESTKQPTVTNSPTFIPEMSFVASPLTCMDRAVEPGGIVTLKFLLIRLEAVLPMHVNEPLVTAGWK